MTELWNDLGDGRFLNYFLPKTQSKLGKPWGTQSLFQLLFNVSRNGDSIKRWATFSKLYL